jgi:hypothetical protein
MFRPATLLIATICCAHLLPAQETKTEYPKLEEFAGYSSVITTDVTIPLPSVNGYGQADLESSRGFEGAVIRNFKRYFGIKADFSAHFGHYQDMDEVPCAHVSCTTTTQEIQSHTRLYEFLAGPEVKWRNHTRFAPFANALFGIAHSSATLSSFGPAIDFSGRQTQTGFAMDFGGGLDIRIVKRASFRLSLDHGNAYGGKNFDGSPRRLDTFRMTVGVLFH